MVTTEHADMKKAIGTFCMPQNSSLACFKASVQPTAFIFAFSLCVNVKQGCCEGDNGSAHLRGKEIHQESDCVLRLTVKIIHVKKILCHAMTNKFYLTNSRAKRLSSVYEQKDYTWTRCKKPQQTVHNCSF